MSKVRPSVESPMLFRGSHYAFGHVLLTRNTYDAYWVCCRPLKTWFNWPKNASYFWLSLHRRPVKNSVKLDIKILGSEFIRYQDPGDDEWLDMFSPSEMVSLLKSLGMKSDGLPKTVYLCLWYEEKTDTGCESMERTAR